MRKILTRRFFDRPAARVARELLGMYLVRRIGETEEAFRIVETEAYVGPHDLACHASRGRTPRTAVLFGPPGRFYVHFIYGMHWMLNIVTARDGYPAGVLIRGVESVNGPGRLTKKLGITGILNRAAASRESGLWFEDRGEHPSARSIARTPRIGVEYAGDIWAKKKLRFVLTRGPRNSGEPGAHRPVRG